MPKKEILKFDWSFVRNECPNAYKKYREWPDSRAGEWCGHLGTFYVKGGFMQTFDNVDLRELYEFFDANNCPVSTVSSFGDRFQCAGVTYPTRISAEHAAFKAAFFKLENL